MWDFACQTGYALSQPGMQRTITPLPPPHHHAITPPDHQNAATNALITERAGAGWSSMGMDQPAFYGFFGVYGWVACILVREVCRARSMGQCPSQRGAVLVLAWLPVARRSAALCLGPGTLEQQLPANHVRVRSLLCAVRPAPTLAAHVHVPALRLAAGAAGGV